MIFILATNNPGKVKEMKTILTDLGIEVITRDDAGITIDVEETGSTFLENATLKAKAICEDAGIPAIADDSGLVVDALGGEPGVYTNSYGGELLNAEERYTYLLEQMVNVEHRSAKFVCAIVCAFPNGRIIIATGECCGSIATAPCGTGGFGYDPVFIPDGSVKTLAELSLEEKNILSHRGKALRSFVNELKGYFE